MSGHRAARWGFGGVIATTAVAALVLAASASGPRPGGSRTPPAGGPQTTPAGGSVASTGPNGVVHGRVAISAVTIELALSQRAARTGQPIQLRSTLTNQSSRRTSRTVVRIVPTPGAVRLRPDDVRIVTNLAAGGSETLTWIACVRAAGSYTFTAEATLGAAVVRSAPQVLTVTAGGSC